MGQSRQPDPLARTVIMNSRILLTVHTQYQKNCMIGWTNVSPISRNITISGQNYTNVNFTNQPILTFNVSGYKINDSDGRGISGWNITIKNSQIQTSDFTDENGFYEFTNVARGNYTIFEELQSEWTNVTPASREIEILDRDILVNFTNKPLVIVSDDFSAPELNTHSGHKLIHKMIQYFPLQVPEPKMHCYPFRFLILPRHDIW